MTDTTTTLATQAVARKRSTGQQIIRFVLGRIGGLAATVFVASVFGVRNTCATG